MNTETTYILQRTVAVEFDKGESRVDFKVLLNGVEVHKAFLTREGPGGYIGEMPSFVQTSEDRAKYIKAAHKLFRAHTASFTLTTKEDNPYTEKWFADARSLEFECERNDLLALKERMEHLPKMIDTLNEMLKKGYSREVGELVYNITHYAYCISRSMDSTKYTCVPNSNGKITAKLY